MLRSIKSTRVGTRLLAYHVTTAASAVNTVNKGKGLGTFTNADNDDEIDLALNDGFARVPVHLCGAGNGIGDGGAAYVGTDPTRSALATRTQDGVTPSADVGDSHNLVVGFDDRGTDLHGGKGEQLFSVYGHRRGGRVIAGQVDSTGSINIGTGQFTVTDNGTGDHTITFASPFGAAGVCIATPVTATQGHSARVESIDASTVNILTFDAANAAADVDFNFVVIGWPDRDDYAMRRGTAIKTAMRLPRLLCFHVTDMSSTIALSIGDEDATIVDDGVGQFTITYNDAFGREPIVIACSGESEDAWCTVATSAAGSCQIEIADTAGSLGDSDDVYVFVLGSDDATEYVNN